MVDQVRIARSRVVFICNWALLTDGRLSRVGGQIIPLF
jgi:hypothetical protein